MVESNWNADLQWNIQPKTTENRSMIETPGQENVEKKQRHLDWEITKTTIFDTEICTEICVVLR